MLSRLLIWTLFNFSRCCLTSFFIAYGKLSILSTTLHEVNASSCFILNTEQKNKYIWGFLCTLHHPLQFYHSSLADLPYLFFPLLSFMPCHSVTFLQPYTSTYSLFSMWVLYVLVSLLFSLLIPCLILRRILSWPFFCVHLGNNGFLGIQKFLLVKTPSYFVKTYNLNLFWWFSVFMPTGALNFGKMILQSFQISCKIRACAFR